jgi:hypothetical protein
MNNLVNLNINNIPHEFKKSQLYNNFIENIVDDTICVYKDYDNFDDKINNYYDIERILKLYKYWMVSDNMFYDFIYKNSLIIIVNYDQFINFINEFEMGQSFISLLKNKNEMYSDIIKNNDMYLLKYLCDNNLINNDFYKYAVKNIDIIKFIKKYSQIISNNLILAHGIKTKDIEYLKFLLKDYKPDLNILVKILCKHKMNDWLLFLFDYLKINYNNLLICASKYENNELIIKILSEKLLTINTEIDIVDLYYNNYNSNEVLSWINDNIMSINTVLQNPNNILELYEDYNIFNDNQYHKIDNFVKADLSDLTIGKLLFFFAMINGTKINLLKWLLKNNFEKSIDMLNLSAYWLNDKNFKWLYNQGFKFDENTIMNALKGGNINNVKFLESQGSILNITDELCNYCYDNDYPELLCYLLIKKPELVNTYLIKSVTDDDYYTFSELFEMNPDFENYIFNGENNILLNKTLRKLVSKCVINKNTTKSLKLQKN